jgi:hypothetical protein
MAIVLLSIDREMLVESSYINDEIDKARQSSSGRIIRQKEPNNLETPFGEVDFFLTPTELFYIRSHSRAPKLELVRVSSLPCTLKNASSVLCGYPA